MSYITSIEQIAAQLRDLESPVTDVQIIAKIIVSLPKEFRHFQSAWDSVPAEEQTLAALTSRLIKEEKMAKMFEKTEERPVDAAYFAGNSFFFWICAQVLSKLNK